MTDSQRVNLGMAVWRLVIRVCCRPRQDYQLFVLTRFLQKLIPSKKTITELASADEKVTVDESSFNILAPFDLEAGAADAIELPYDHLVKLTYVMRYTFSTLEELVKFVGYEALHQYCFEEPVDSCELGDFIDLLAAYHPQSTFLVMVSVYVQVPVDDAVYQYLNSSNGPKRVNNDAVQVADSYFNLGQVVPVNFFENTLMQYNSKLFENSLDALHVDMIDLTQNFNSLQLLYELSWLIKEYLHDLGDIDYAYKVVVSRKLWYIRLLIEPALSVNNNMQMVFDKHSNLDPFIDVLTYLQAPLFCYSSKYKTLWKDCGNICMIKVANYLKSQN